MGLRFSGLEMGFGVYGLGEFMAWFRATEFRCRLSGYGEGSTVEVTQKSMWITWRFMGSYK